MPKRTLFKAPYEKRPVSNEHFPCDDLLDGDGEDPRLDSSPRKIDNRKARQLCAQVSEAIGLALIESHDLSNLWVKSVKPAPNSSQLLVTLIPYPAWNNQKLSHSEILAAVQKASGWLRSEISQAITRKRTPQLKFEIKYDEKT